MQQYPTISKDVISGLDYYVFNKLDGSNIRVEYSLKKGFDKFGTRKKLMSDDSGILNKSKELILKTEENVYNIFKKNKWQSGTLFFEFYGSNSFAGFHKEDDDFKTVLIDAHIYNKGYLSPKEYIKEFDLIEMAEFLGIYKLNSNVIADIRAGVFEGMSFEGIIGKSFNRNKIIRCKVKNKAWIDKLKHKCGDDLSLFEQLS